MPKKAPNLTASAEMSTAERVVALVDPTPIATEPLREMAAKSLGEQVAQEILATIEQQMDNLRAPTNAAASTATSTSASEGARNTL